MAKIIAVDFDGTCVLHEYPRVGADVPYAVETLQELTKQGNKLILFTMRSGPTLDDAVAWFKKHEIPLAGVNTNPDQKRWTNSPKAYAHLYIDDAALGCPLVYEDMVSRRPYVDWLKVRELLHLQKEVERSPKVAISS